MNELPPLICSIVLNFDLKLLFSNCPVHLRHHKKFKTLFTDFKRSESYTEVLSWYRAIRKLYILYYPIKLPGLPFQLIHFRYATSREKLRTVPSFHISFPYFITRILLVRGNLWRFAHVIIWGNHFSCKKI